MFDSQFMALPGITPQEYTYLQTATNGLNEQQLRTFLMIYSGKRKSPSDILLFTLLAFVGVAGEQRFVTGQIGMGILYLFTAGLCLIGTIVDLINHKDLAFEHNQRMAFESLQMTRMSNF
jgi:TM2 domain-containing membrane protein YozV